MAGSRIEALLASFPKLITSDSQHTSVETDTVRYVYQPLEDLYMILITTKNSNILQDIDTLHLLARAVSDQCHSLDEHDILLSCFEILEAFDEIVSLGYRENVTLTQVRSMLEMDSHEERIHEIIERNKELEAKEELKRRARQLEMQRRDAARRNSSGIPTSGGYQSLPRTFDQPAAPVHSMPQEQPQAPSAPVSNPLRGKGMQLGKKNKGAGLMGAIQKEIKEQPQPAPRSPAQPSPQPAAPKPKPASLARRESPVPPTPASGSFRGAHDAKPAPEPSLMDEDVPPAARPPLGLNRKLPEVPSAGAAPAAGSGDAAAMFDAFDAPAPGAPVDMRGAQPEVPLAEPAVPQVVPEPVAEPPAAEPAAQPAAEAFAQVHPPAEPAVPPAAPTPAPAAPVPSAEPPAPAAAVGAADVPPSSVHLVVKERLTATGNRDGGLESLEVKGDLLLRVSDASLARLRVHVGATQSESLGAEPQYRTHPHVDKQAWSADHTIALRDAKRPFPVNQQVGVLRWRALTRDETAMPISISVWTNPTGDGGCEVNVEYELENQELTLSDLTLAIPVPPGAEPIVEAPEQGTFAFDPQGSRLIWRPDVVSAAAPSGNLEFAVQQGGDEVNVFFPLTVDFVSTGSLTGLQVADVVSVDSGTALPFSVETHLSTEGFLIK